MREAAQPRCAAQDRGWKAEHRKNLPYDSGRAAQRDHGGQRRIDDVQLKHQESQQEGSPLRHVVAVLVCIDVAEQQPDIKEEEKGAQELLIDGRP